MKTPTDFKAYLRFNKKERIGIIILLLIIAGFSVLPFLNFFPTISTSDIDTSWMKANEQLQLKESQTNMENRENPSYYQIDRTENIYQPSTRTSAPARLFNFDPNTLGESGWKELGLRDRTIRTLLNYRSKGGKFRKPDDLQKIYGLRPDEFERLRPYISITTTNENKQQYQTYNNDRTSSPATFEAKPSYRPKAIDINTAGIEDFKSLYGIGDKLAARIVNFRTKLGGFYSVDQVGETYGVPDSTFKNIKAYLQLNNKQIQKLNINTATYDELNAHPYISSKLAYLILKQKKEKGNFTNIENLKELVSQTNDSYEKVINYVVAE